jgi:hypothetical protein
MRYWMMEHFKEAIELIIGKVILILIYNFCYSPFTKSVYKGRILGVTYQVKQKKKELIRIVAIIVWFFKFFIE